MTRYKHGTTEIESSSDLLALSQIRYITNDVSISGLNRWDGQRWAWTHVNQMLYGPNAKTNIKNAFGSTSVSTLRKAEKIYG